MQAVASIPGTIPTLPFVPFSFLAVRPVVVQQMAVCLAPIRLAIVHARTRWLSVSGPAMTSSLCLHVLAIAFCFGRTRREFKSTAFALATNVSLGGTLPCGSTSKQFEPITVLFLRYAD